MVENITETCCEARLKWSGHVKMRDQDYVGRKTLEMVPPSWEKKKRKTEVEMDGLVNRYMRSSERRKMKSRTELAGGYLCLP